MKELAKEKFKRKVENIKTWISWNRSILLGISAAAVGGAVFTILTNKGIAKICKNSYDEGYDDGFKWLVRTLGYSEEDINSGTFMYGIPKDPKKRITTIGDIFDEWNYSDEQRAKLLNDFNKFWPFPDKPFTEENVVSQVDIVRIDK